ncbi:unnamed protein product [Pylaiella littoralis]
MDCAEEVVPTATAAAFLKQFSRCGSSASILTRLLGEYVEDSTFNAESVKLGIWRGYLVLEDMHIKKSLMDMLELPLALRHGILGRLEIQIPWSTINKDPILIAVERVFLVVEPKFEWDAGAVKRRERAVKHAKLTAAELFRTSPLDESPSGSTEGPPKSRWGAGLQKWVTDRLVTRIVDSLQIHVREVHVRYEDRISNPAAPFYVGATIESLQVESTDEGWGIQPEPLFGPISRAGSGGGESGGGGGGRSAWRGGDVAAHRKGGEKQENGGDDRSGAADVFVRASSGGGGGGGGGDNSDSSDDEATAALGARGGRSGGGSRRSSASGGGGGDRLVKKSLRLNQLAVYWNPAEDGNPCSMHLSDIPVEQAEVVISRLIARSDDEGVEGGTSSSEAFGSTGASSSALRHRYVLKPVDATARLALSVDPSDRSQPRLQAQVDLGAISCLLEPSAARYGEVGRYFKHRPEVPVRVDPAAWWRFAFTVVVEKLRADGFSHSCRWPDLEKRRKLRLEYMPLWKKARGLSSATAADDDVDYDDDHVGGIGSPRSSSSSSSSSSSASDAVPSWSSGVDVDTSSGGGDRSNGSGGLGRSKGRRGSRSRSRGRERSVAGGEEDDDEEEEEEEEEEEAVATARARLEELEEELSVEDIIIFRGIAEREEAALLRGASSRDSKAGGRKRWGTGRWGAGSWVSWAMGTGAGAGASASTGRPVEVKQEDGGRNVGDGQEEDEDLRRLFAAIDFDPSRATPFSSSLPPPPPPPPAQGGGDGVGATGWGGWLAVSLDLRASEGALVLAGGTGAAAGGGGAGPPKKLPRLLLSSFKQPEAEPFMDVRFGGLEVCAELHGEDMDGVLASVTLDNLGVYELSHHDASSGAEKVGRSSPIIVRRDLRGITEGGRGGGGGRGRAASTESSSPASLSSSSSPPLRPPLFEMHLEMNPRNPEYDAKVYLAVDQVEAVLSPTAGWVLDVLAFAQAPETLQHRATLELAATNQLKNLRVQLESRLEMAMSNRFLTFLDLDVKAPLVVIPVDLDGGSGSGSGGCSGGRAGVEVEIEAEPAVDDGNEDTDEEERGARHEEEMEGETETDSREERRNDDAQGARGGSGGGGGGREATKASGVVADAVAVVAPTRELLVVDLGNVSFTTSRLAQHVRRQSNGGNYKPPPHAATAAAAAGGGGGEGEGVNWSSSGNSNGTAGGGGVAVAAATATEEPRQKRVTSDEGFSSGAGRGGGSGVGRKRHRVAGESWHAKFYDVYKVEVHRVGVLLLAGRADGGDGAGRRSGGGGSGGGGDGGKRWLVDPFDVKMELHLSVMPNDPSVSQLKVYGDLPRLHVRLSQAKLRRLAVMSAAIAAQSQATMLAASNAETAAVVAAEEQSFRIVFDDERAAEWGGDRRAATSDASNGSAGAGDGGGSGGGMSSLASFLEFQRSLSQRFDDLHEHQPRDQRSVATPESSPATTTAPLGRRELRRLRLSDQNLDWGGGGGRGWGGGGGRRSYSSSRGGGGGGTNGGDEEFASAWGGSSWGGGDGGRSERSSRSSSFVSAAESLGCPVYGDDGGGGGGGGVDRVGRSLSGESDFYDAADGGEDGEGESPPISPDRWVRSAAAAGAAAAAAAATPEAEAPQPGSEDTGSGEEGWDIGASALAAALEKSGGDESGGGGGGGGDDSSDGDSLDFQDARDPVSEMDEALMAKEAERAELMKQRQKLQKQLDSPEDRRGLTGAGLERVRSASEEVSQRLEACEDELKDLESALEELTEAFGQAAERMRLGNDEFGPAWTDGNVGRPRDSSRSDVTAEENGHDEGEEETYDASGGDGGGGGVEFEGYARLKPPPPLPPPRSLLYPPPAPPGRGGGVPDGLPLPAGPNREVVMCGLTVPLIQVDLLQDVTTAVSAPPKKKRNGGGRAAAAASAAAASAAAKDRERSGSNSNGSSSSSSTASRSSLAAPESRVGGEDGGDGEEYREEEDVVSLRLVGLGVQLHSKSHGARFSFSMQDLDLEDRLQASRRGRPGVESRSASAPATFAEEGEETKTRDDVLCSTPPSTAVAPSRRGSSGGGSDVGERPAGDMATTRPRLCLWQPPRERAGAGGDGSPLRRREVTFRDCEAVADEAAAEGISGGGGGGKKTTGGGGGRVGGGSGNVLLRPDFIQLSYAMNKSYGRGGCAGGAGAISELGVQRGKESHRVKLLVGAVEVALEQETIIAIMRIVSSLSVTPPPPPPPSSSASSLPPPTASPGAPVRSDPTPATPSAAPEPSVSEFDATSVKRSPPASMAGGGEGEGVSMPMLPPGVSVSVVVDLAAMSVALAESGVNIVAVALRAAHCKVNAESIRVKAVMSLGDMYVLNLRRPPPPLQRLPPAPVRGRGVSPFDSDASAAAPADTDAAHRQRGRGGVERGGHCFAAEDDCPLAWVEPPLGRGEGAIGPMLDIALVVVPCGMGGVHARGGGGGGGGVGDCASMVSAAGGLEARVKIRLDGVRTNVSIPFVENLTLHVLSGPLVSLLLGKDVAAGLSQNPGGAGSSTSLSPSPPPMVPPPAGRAHAAADETRRGVGDLVDSNNAAAAADAVTGPAPGRSSSLSSMPTVAPAEKLTTRRWEGAGDAPQEDRNGMEDGDSWEQVVLMKVGLEVCDCALGISFDGLGTGGDRHPEDALDRASRVTARLGHLFVNTTWTQPATAVGSSNGSSAGRLDVESLLSSAAVTMEPEEFDVLQEVHARVVGAVPLGGMGGGANDAIRGSGGGSGRVPNNSHRRDDLAEKLREKTSRDDPAAVTSLPSRPVLCFTHGDGDDSDAPERAQLGVAVSPIRFNLTETHMLSLACFALGASARLTTISDIPASPSSPDVEEQDSRSANDSAVREPGVGLAPEESDRGGRASTSGSSTAAASQATEVEVLDDVRAVGDADGEVCGNAGQAAAVAEAEVEVAAAKRQVPASSLPPRGEQEAPHTPDDIPPQHQHSDGLLSITEDRLGGALGRSDQQQPSGQLACGGEPAPAAAAADVSETAVAKAPPVPPAFLGTLIIEAISVMLLEDSGDYTGVAGATGDGPIVGVAAGTKGELREQPASARSANAAVFTSGPPHPALSPRCEPFKRRRQDACTSTALFAHSGRCYSGMVFLEVEGIGVGVDLPQPWRTPSPPTSPPPPRTTAAQPSPSSPVGSPVAAAAVAAMEEGNSEGGYQREHQQQYRAEFAIKRISLTDVTTTRRRQNSLAVLVSDGVPSAAADTATVNNTAESSTGGAETRCRDTDEDNVRVLPGGWWHRRNCGNSGDAIGRYGEQVLFSARVCPVLGVATVDAHLASGRIMLLPAPILDALDMAAGVSQGVAKFLLHTAAAESSAESNDGARSTGVRAAQVAAAESVALPAEHEARASSVAVAISSTPDDEGASPRGESAAGGGQQTGDGAADSVPPVVSGRRDTTNDAGQEDPGDSTGVLSPSRREDGGGDAPADIQEQRHREDWRWQTARALGGAGLADLLRLRRIDVSASAKNLQVWLPGLEKGAAAATAAAVDGSVRGGVEAVVAACDHLFADVSIAVGLLSEGAGVEDSAEQLADPAAPGGATDEPGWSDAQQSAVVSGEADAGNAAAAAVATDSDAAETAFVDSCDELCVMVLGFHGLEVFTARSSTADFGAPAGESPQPVVVSADLDAGNGEQPPAAPECGREGLILPFSAKIKHVVLARSPSWSFSASPEMPPSPSPLLSEVDVTVTVIRMDLFLDFPVATRIMENSLSPLLAYGTPASTGASATRVPAAGTGAAGTPSVIHGLSPTSQGDGGGGLAGSPTEPAAAVAATPTAAPGEAAAVSELARMWTCRVGFEAAGLRAEIVNNFHRQKRPCVTLNVPTITCELTASGAARSLQASVSAEIESGFYNARLMAWEPLVELWAARVELEASVGGDARCRSRQEPSSDSSAERERRFSGVTRRSSGGLKRDGLGRRFSTHRVFRQQRESAVAPRREKRGAAGRVGKVDGPAAAAAAAAEVFVGLRFVSHEVLNVNLTESLVENLAAVVHAQQRQEESQNLERGWAGEGDNSFSLHWLRNETGLPIGCSARYREPRGGARSRGGTDGKGDSGAALPVRVPAGEEAPVAASLDLPVRAVVLELEGKEDGGERGGGGGGGGGMASSAGTVVAAAAAATTLSTRWRSVRSVALDVVGGQRLTTMVATEATSSLCLDEDGSALSAVVAAEHLQSSVSDRGTAWRSGSWTWAARADAVPVPAGRGRGVETVKVVTEVEFYRGVKVLRVRSLLEVANDMSDSVCIHVGLLGEGAVSGAGRQPRLVPLASSGKLSSCPVNPAQCPPPMRRQSWTDGGLSLSGPSCATTPTALGSRTTRVGALANHLERVCLLRLLPPLAPPPTPVPVPLPATSIDHRYIPFQQPRQRRSSKR